MRSAAVAVGFGLLTVAMAAPWSLHPGTRLLVDDADMRLMFWTLGWNAHALATAPWRIFDANIFHPDGNTLAYSEHLIGPAAIVAPVVWTTGNLVLAFSVASMLACALCGLGAYLLGRRLGLGAGAAFVVGIVFAFSPSRFFRMSQLHINAVMWLPLALGYLHTYLDGGGRRDLRLALVCLTAQVLTSGHGAAFTVVAMATLACYRLAAGMPVALTTRLRDVGAWGVAAMLPIVPVALRYRRAQVEVGLVRSLENWQVTPESFLASPSHVDQALMALVTDRPVNETANAFLFPGVIVLLLAAAAVVPARRLRSAVTVPRGVVGFYVVLSVMSVLLFVDGPFGLWPWVYWWPGFSFVRVPSRFAVLALLALAVLAGIGLQRLTSGWPTRRAAAATALTSVLLLAEFSAHPFEGRDYRLEIPAIDQWLATQPGPIVVVEVPAPRPSAAGPFERFQTTAMLHSTAHWRPTINGYSGIRPPRHERLWQDLAGFPDAPSLTALRGMGVTHVVVHLDSYAPGEWPAAEARLTTTEGLRLLHEAADGRVYALEPGQLAGR